MYRDTSRASSSRVAIELVRLRMVCGEIAVRLPPSPRIAAIGASKTGARPRASPGSARRNPLTQAISGNSRRTCRNDSRMPTTSTPMISALRPGLARNAVQICPCRMKTSNPPRMRNTSIRTRKIRGEETLKGSLSAIRGAMAAPLAAHLQPPTMAHQRQKVMAAAQFERLDSTAQLPAFRCDLPPSRARAVPDASSHCRRRRRRR